MYQFWRQVRQAFVTLIVTMALLPGALLVSALSTLALVDRPRSVFSISLEGREGAKGREESLPSGKLNFEALDVY